MDPQQREIPEAELRPWEAEQEQNSYRPPETQLTDPMRRRKRLVTSVLLFLATCASTFWIGTGFRNSIHDTTNEILMNGAVYSGAVMLILLSHEMGHYLQSVRYGVPASFPFFIPFPNLFGTLGAVILQGRGADRKAMFDIAISGPLAGLVFTLPCAYYGLRQAEIITVNPNEYSYAFGDPLILKWMTGWIIRPLEQNEDVLLNPLLFAAWVGFFITALNLVPIGQLDGGHILYTLIGKRAHYVAQGFLIAAIGYMIYTSSYAYTLMVVLLLLMGPKHPPTANDNVPIGTFRIVLGWITLAFVIIGLSPNPLIINGV